MPTTEIGGSVLSSQRNFAYRDSVSISGILTRAVTVIRLYPGATLGSALLITMLPIILVIVAGILLSVGFMTAGTRGMPPFLTLFLVLALAGSTLMIGSLAAQAAMARALIAHEQGDAVTFRGCLATSFGKLIPLLGLSFLTSMGLMFGFILLIFPGVMLAVIWSVAAPALASEDLGVLGALSRSADLTRGHRWMIFGLCAMTYVFYLIVSRVLGVLGSAIDVTGDWTGLSGAMSIAGAVFGGFIPLLFWTMCIAVWGAVSASLYIELRTAQEGPLANSLADVFA
jgi:hypothetical protein